MRNYKYKQKITLKIRAFDELVDIKYVKRNFNNCKPLEDLKLFI